MGSTSGIKTEEWSVLALVLGIEDSTFSRIKQKCYIEGESFHKCIVKEWLARGQASWASLVTALKHDLVNRVDIANKITKDHLQPLRHESCKIIEYSGTNDQSPTLGANTNKNGCLYRGGLYIQSSSFYAGAQLNGNKFGT